MLGFVDQGEAAVGPSANRPVPRPVRRLHDQISHLPDHARAANLRVDLQQVNLPPRSAPRPRRRSSRASTVFPQPTSPSSSTSGAARHDLAGADFPAVVLAAPVGQPIGVEQQFQFQQQPPSCGRRFPPKPVIPCPRVRVPGSPLGFRKSGWRATSCFRAHFLALCCSCPGAAGFILTHPDLNRDRDDRRRELPSSLATASLSVRLADALSPGFDMPPQDQGKTPPLRHVVVAGMPLSLGDVISSAPNAQHAKEVRRLRRSVAC